MKRRMVAAGMLLLAAVYALPVLLTLTSSFMEQSQLTGMFSGATGLRVVPRQATLDGYYDLLFAGSPYLQMFWQSVMIATCASLGSTVVSLVVGFALAKVPMRGGRAMRFAYMLLMMMPLQVTILPNYIMLRQLGLYNTQWALIVPGIFAPLSVFLVSQFMRTLPDEIMEAALLETNSAVRVAVSIIAPMSRPALVAQFLLSFAEAWNMVEQPLVLLEDAWRYPLSLALNNVSGNGVQVAFAGAVLYLMPIIFLYRAFEKELVQGIGAPEMKGGRA